jgi:hypothetical protein
MVGYNIILLSMFRIYQGKGIISQGFIFVVNDLFLL